MTSHHFAEHQRSNEIPPWGVEPAVEGKKGGLMTTNQWMFQGLKGSPTKPIRNHTSNHFNPQTWRNKSSYREMFHTPQMYSRHQVERTSPFRNHRPHPKEFVWPMEPNKSYVIWNPKTNRDLSQSYSAPSLLRHYRDLQTKAHSTYQDHYNTQPIQSQHRSRNILTREKMNSEKRYYTQEQAGIPMNMRTDYQMTYYGDRGRPSTDSRPIDYSWKNIQY